MVVTTILAEGCDLDARLIVMAAEEAARPTERRAEDASEVQGAGCLQAGCRLGSRDRLCGWFGDWPGQEVKSGGADAARLGRGMRGAGFRGQVFLQERDWGRCLGRAEEGRACVSRLKGSGAGRNRSGGTDIP